MGFLKCDSINLNDKHITDKLRDAINQLIKKPSSYFSLAHKPEYYFEIINGNLPSEKGWYIILSHGKPIYVGKAGDLNKRLNSNHGSIDNFANKSRASDSERNFIKKFEELEIMSNIKVCIIMERDLCARIGMSPRMLTELDRGNIEKIIDLFRCHFSYV